MVAVARVRMPENGVFQCRVPEALTLLPGDRCLVELDYGLDIGTVLYLQDKRGVEEEDRTPAYRVVRKCSENELAREAEQAERAEESQARPSCCRRATKGHVKVLHARFSYGGGRFFIRYTAQVPVDLRRFVGQVQRDFKTRSGCSGRWGCATRRPLSILGDVWTCGVLLHMATSVSVGQRADGQNAGDVVKSWVDQRDVRTAEMLSAF